MDVESRPSDDTLVNLVPARSPTRPALLYASQAHGLVLEVSVLSAYDSPFTDAIRGAIRVSSLTDLHALCMGPSP